jgi:hypothetical protein
LEVTENNGFPFIDQKMSNIEDKINKLN